MTDLTQDRLIELFDHDEERGVLIWRPRPRSEFRSEGAFTAWNKRFAGKVAGCIKQGRRIIRVEYQPYLAYRLIWLRTYGEWPDTIDHINGNPSDDRLSNLRSVSHVENTRNMCRRSDNTSGHTGVYFNRNRGKWVAQIIRLGKGHYLGMHDTLEAAVAARAAANPQFGFHPNHGRGA